MREIKEKVNKLWDFIETHYTEKDEYPKDLYGFLEDFIDIEKENQELIVNKNVAQGIAKKFKEENLKLKKAIEILNDKLDIKLEVYHNGGCILNHKVIRNCIIPNERCLRYLEVEEYELLKEVLEND
jgi:hypothetical protein